MPDTPPALSPSLEEIAALRDDLNWTPLTDECVRQYHDFAEHKHRVHRNSTIRLLATLVIRLSREVARLRSLGTPTEGHHA